MNLTAFNLTWIHPLLKSDHIDTVNIPILASEYAAKSKQNRSEEV
jgi:hypothetical protein